jgi:hypothetical protein
MFGSRVHPSWPEISRRFWSWPNGQPRPTVLRVMTDAHNLDRALLRWLEAKLANSDEETYHENALNYLIGLLLSEWDAPEAAAMAPVM